MVNIFIDQTPTPLQLRQELDTLVRQDLPGPAGGEHDEDLLTVDGATKSQDKRADMAVVATCGWQDLALDPSFHKTAQGLRYTISEPAHREVLTRRLQLNHQRYEEEVAQGFHYKKKKKSTQRRKTAKSTKKKEPKKNDGQLSLF